MKFHFFIGFMIGFIPLSGIAQNRWVQQYHPELTGPGRYIEVSYDNGYLLTGKVSPNLSHYSWLIKTDINGDILWEKFFGGYYNSVIVGHIKQNCNGDIYLGGGINHQGNSDPLIVKLNECGDKEWCRIISTTSDIDFFRSTVVTLDNGCAALIYAAFHPMHIYRSGIFKFSSEGDIEWQQYYQSPDEGVSNEDLSHLLLTPDSGFLMTGYCYYPDPDNPTLSWLHPYFVKVDSLGNFEWETILHSETADLGGKGKCTIISPSQSYYYSCISHYYHSDTLYATRPAFVKMDLQGNIAGVYDLVHEDYNWGTLFSGVFINDSTLAGGAGWGYDEQEPQSRAIIFDTLGTIKDSLTLLNTGWLSQVAKTFDDKLLFYNTIEENGIFSNYLFKLNQDLEHDSIYTTPFTYDSLCPYQIVSDTIVPDDCGVIVGVEDGRTVRRYEGEGCELEVWPNPCSSVVSISLTSRQSSVFSHQSIDRCTIVIYDIFGRKAGEATFSPSLEGRGRGWGTAWTVDDGGWMMDVSALPPGLYLMVVKDGASVKVSVKFVVAR